MEWLDGFIDSYLVNGILQMQYGRAYVVLAIFFCLFAGLAAQTILSWSLTKQIKLFRDYRKAWHKGVKADPEELWAGVLHQYQISAAKGNEQVNTGVLLDDAYETIKMAGGPLQIDLERVYRLCMSILLMLGLIGTFLGLTQSLFEIRGVLQQMGVDTLAQGDLLGQVIQRLLLPLQQMSTAFITSLAGIGSAMMLSITALLLRVEQLRDSFFIEAEDFLDNELFPTLTRPNSIQGAGEILADKFQVLFSQLSKELAGHFEQSMSKNTQEIKELYGTLQRTLTDLSRFAGNLSQSGESFAGGAKHMDRVAFSLSQQATAISRATGSMSETVASVSYAVTRLDGALEGIVQATRNNNEILAAVGQKVEGNLNQLAEGMDKVCSVSGEQMRTVLELTQDLQQTSAGVRDIGEQVGMTNERILTNKQNLDQIHREMMNMQEKLGTLQANSQITTSTVAEVAASEE